MGCNSSALVSTQKALCTSSMFIFKSPLWKKQKTTRTENTRYLTKYITVMAVMAEGKILCIIRPFAVWNVGRLLQLSKIRWRCHSPPPSKLAYATRHLDMQSSIADWLLTHPVRIWPVLLMNQCIKFDFYWRAKPEISWYSHNG